MQPKLETPQVTCNKLAGVSFGPLTKVEAYAPELNLQHPPWKASLYLLTYNWPAYRRRDEKRFNMLEEY